jgi:hypothetical protein
MEETLAAGAASTTATEMDMSWDNIMEGIASEYGGYTILAVMSGIYMKALMNTMYPVSGDQATIKSKSPYVYMALYILGVYGFSMSWIFKESDFDPALTLAIFKLGPGYVSQRTAADASALVPRFMNAPCEHSDAKANGMHLYTQLPCDCERRGVVPGRVLVHGVWAAER